MYRVYVGNLPYSVRQSQELSDYFASAGKVKEAIVVLLPDGRSKGFGFVEFEDEAGFKAALAMDGRDWQGRPVRVSEARPSNRDNGGDRPSRDDNFRPAPKAEAKVEDEDESEEAEAPAAAATDEESSDEE